MHEFTDNKNRTWRLEITCDTIEQVQADCGVNLLDIVDPDSNLLKEVNAFPPLMAKLLFAAIADQAATAGVDAKQFRSSMGGDALATATDALLDEIVHFFPQHRRTLLTAVLEKNREVEEAGTELALARVADPELKRQAMAALDRRLTASMAASLERLADESPAAHSAIGTALGTGNGSSTSAGTVPASSDSPAPDLTPTADSVGSPTEPTSLTLT